jgi:hypothetical protein
MATRERDLNSELGSRPSFICENAEGNAAVSNLRVKNAQQAKIELLIWLAKHAATEKHRLAVIEPALEQLDSAHQRQFAVDILEIVKDPQSRHNVIPKLCRRYALDPYPLHVNGEDE